ncbi:Guanine nucleotide exchange factor (GEF) which may activate RAB8A and RAB8B [Apophysomyces ossiformis]|uniref:Guanine nucleotide exchange factor (GEF) which may activate RAB8A and RAB8B n=1 Tax=Apophysomyces ossiformis TaxID=679940 RepID=A0A8H7BU05_9FUNG|nr:Guanine nucleotide exchange factor (GEF) which may activate RAB8A and RAB8B [Apophysomyces ossiformis]
MSSPQQSTRAELPDTEKELPTQSAPHDKDITAKDIANLYSRLQAVIDKVHSPNEPVNPEAKFIPLPPSLPLSPSSSSPLPFHFPMQKVTTPRLSDETIHEETGSATRSVVDCPCHHILVSKDSKHCALCDRVIPIMEQLHNERDAHEQEIKSLQQKLSEEQARINQQLEEINQLNTKIEHVEQRLDEKSEEFQALQNDMELLNDKYVDEIERVAEIQHSKDMVESELEDLSRRLFEEANGMVANEKREKYNLEIAQKHLENQLKETQERLAAEQMQLKELRQKMSEMQSQQSCKYGQTTDEAISDESGLSETEQRAVKDLASLFSERLALKDLDPKEAIGVDEMMLDEFKEFVTFGTSIPLKKLHTIPFMKNCQTEDVEPCLRFGPNSRLSARKINDAIVMNTCYIEEAPPGYAEEQAKRSTEIPLKISASKTMIWERFSSANSQGTPFIGCQACGRNNNSPLPYRFRISYFDDWACIDRYCRDRLVAVCEYYVFIRNVRQGYYSSRTIPDLYQEAMRLRLQMFYARMGALPWTLRNAGVKNDAVGTASPPNVLVPPPVSESSPLPRTNSVRQQPMRRSVDDKTLGSTSVEGKVSDTLNTLDGEKEEKQSNETTETEAP